MLLAVRPPDDDVRALTEEILARPEYARWRDAEADILVQIFRWIGDYLSWTQRLEAESPLLFGLFLAGLAAVALALLAHIVWSVRVALAVPPPPETERRPVERPRWAEEAERLAREGRFLEGAHRLVLGSIDVLVRRGLIELGRADPNRVLRERIQGSPLPDAARARFLGLLDAFEERWFRDRLEDRTLYRAWRELYAELDTGARSPA